jgi:hypothetical protein
MESSEEEEDPRADCTQAQGNINPLEVHCQLSFESAVV